MATYIRKKEKDGLGDGQQYWDDDGVIHDPKEERKELLKPSEGNKSALGLLNSRDFDIRNFHKEYNDNTEHLLMEVLSKQSNDAPLKKGSEEIAYRCDIIIFNNKTKFSIPENNLFDIICGEISSKPEDLSYCISAKRAAQLMGYKQVDNGYRVLKEAASSLASKPFMFEIPVANGKNRVVKISWYEALTYCGADSLSEDDDEAYISFQPSNFFKLLTISSSISHGAHYNIAVSTKIRSKYVRNLYYFLESRKRYKMNPASRPGELDISLDDIISYFGFPPHYRYNDIKRVLLEPAMMINDIEGIDIQFSYSTIKGKGKRVVGVHFSIRDAREVVLEASEVSEENVTSDPTVGSMDHIVKSMLDPLGFTEEEILSITKAYNKYNRDISYLTNGIVTLSNARNVENRVGFMISYLKGDITPSSFDHSAKSNRNNSGFNNFTERNNDYEQLQKQLLEQSMGNN